MAQPRDIRRAAFEALYQIDARGGRDLEEVREGLDDSERLKESERERAFELARLAWEHRAEADATTLELAPDWPAHRQAAVDRTILRLALYEMTRGGAPPKVIVNEAVELAKAYSTEKSPAFVNALLDRVLKRLGDRPAVADESETSGASWDC